MPRKLFIYLWSEYWPGLALGLLTFLLVMLMMQMVRLVEFFLVNHVPFLHVVSITLNLIQSLLPALLPISGLFASVLTLSRLSNDSELVSLLALGLSPKRIFLFFSIVGGTLTLANLYITLFLAPRGNYAFEKSITEISANKAQTQLRENTFNNFFSRMVVYAQKIEPFEGQLEKVFLFDGSQAAETSILAKQGRLYSQIMTGLGQKILWLHLQDGAIHIQNEWHTKIHFKEYKTKLLDLEDISQNIKKSNQSWTFNDFQFLLKDSDTHLEARIELNKRLSMSVACFILTLFGAAAGASVNRRQATNSFAISLLVIITYWVFISMGEVVVRKQWLPAEISLWFSNILFSLLFVRLYRKRFMLI